MLKMAHDDIHHFGPKSPEEGMELATEDVFESDGHAMWHLFSQLKAGNPLREKGQVRMKDKPPHGWETYEMRVWGEEIERYVVGWVVFG